MAGYQRKYGLASAIDGFSSGLATGANVGMNLAAARNQNNRDARDEARQRRQDAIGARMDEARIGHLEEQTAGMKDNRARAATGQKVEDAAVQAEVNMMSQIYAARENLRQSNPQQFKELADGMMMAGEIEMNTGESWRAAALVFSEGNLEPIKAVDEQASAGVKKLLSDAFGMDVSKVEEVRIAADGGLEVVSGGKVVGKVDEFQRVNLMSGMMKQARKHYVSSAATIKEAEAMLRGGVEKDPKTVSLPNGATGLLRKDESGQYGIDELPVRPVPGGLMSAKSEESADGQLKDVRVGDEHFTGRVKGGQVTPLKVETPPPKYAWEAAATVVENDGVKTRDRRLKNSPSRWSNKWKLEDLVKEAKNAKAESKAKYNDAIKEWVHGYIEDAIRKAGAAAEGESQDGRFTRARLDELVVEQMDRDGLSGLLRYLKANPELK
jgi:hypothetical protein